jgi:large conductance mechanosensitive channel
MAILKEFKEFALKGNVVDLAIGVIIGAAFGKIVDSLVADVFMPIIGWVTGGIDFTNKFIPLTGAAAGQATYEAAKKAGATIGYGTFITTAVNFVLIAWVLFMLVKSMNQLKRQEEAKPAAAPEKPEDVRLLGEIRDLLKSRA